MRACLTDMVWSEYERPALLWRRTLRICRFRSKGASDIQSGIVGSDGWVELLADDWITGQPIEELHLTGEYVTLDEIKYEPPFPQPGKVICVMLNYRGMIDALQTEVPSKLTFAAKFGSALIGSGQTIELPPGAKEVTYEGELALVMSRDARNLSRSRAREAIAGYTLFNDVSALDVSRTRSNPVLAKSFDTFGPCGPYLLTAEEIPVLADVELTTLLNGERVQRSMLADMVHDVFTLVEMLSAELSLEAGDVIATGSPAGTAQFHVPPKFLKDGDLVQVSAPGFGVLTNPVRAADSLSAATA